MQKLRFNESIKLHRKIAALSRCAHVSARKGTGLDTVEEKLANCVGELWGINKSQMSKITELYGLLQQFRHTESTEEEVEDEEEQ